MKYNKIHIVGIYGSGKSTLAKKILKILKYKIYDLDEIKYKRKYDLIRSVKERKEIIKKISKKKNWITEGAWLDYAKELYEKADLVIFLEIPEKIIKKRIWKRFIKRKLSKEKYIENTIKTTKNISKKINQYFHDKDHFMTLQSHQDYMKKHSKNFIILKNNKQIKEFLKKLT